MSIYYRFYGLRSIPALGTIIFVSTLGCTNESKNGGYCNQTAFLQTESAPSHVLTDSLVQTQTCEEFIAFEPKLTYSPDYSYNSSSSCYQTSMASKDHSEPIMENAVSAPVDQNSQEVNVAENDIILSNGSQLVIVEKSFVEIYNLDSMESTQVIETSKSSLEFKSGFLNKKRLVLIEQHHNQSYYLDSITYAPQPKSTHVKIYDLNDEAQFEHVKTTEISGTFVTARSANDSMTVVLQSNHFDLANELKNDDNSRLKVSCSGNSLSKSRSSGITRVIRFDLNDIENDVDQISVSSNSPKVYASETSLYLASSDYSSYSTAIHRIAIDPSEELTLKSSGLVSGDPYSQWAMKELTSKDEEIVLSIATHNSRTQTNMLTMLAEDNDLLINIGSTDAFAKGETIRSVRYIDSLAYIVTYRTTDPLFVIDLSEVDNPRIRSELKVPGYASYLHPIGNDRLLGLGFAEGSSAGRVAGIGVNLFDVSDPEHSKLISELEFGSRNTNSTARSNHLDFFHDSDSNIVGFPVLDQISKYQLIKVENNSTLTSFATIDHSKLIHEECENQSIDSNSITTGLSHISRVVKISDFFVSVSKGLLIKHDSLESNNESEHTLRRCFDKANSKYPVWYE